MADKFKTPTSYVQLTYIRHSLKIKSLSSAKNFSVRFQRGDEIADVWEPEKRMRLQSLKRAFCGSYEMPPETEDNDQDQTADQQQTSEEDKRMRLQSLQKRMRLQSLQKRMRLQSLQKRMRLQSMSKRMRLQSL